MPLKYKKMSIHDPSATLTVQVEICKIFAEHCTKVLIESSHIVQVIGQNKALDRFFKHVVQEGVLRGMVK